MAHTYASTLIHYVFSTKRRGRTIKPEFQPELWAYMGGIARLHHMKALAVGGVEDHAHVLLSLPATMAVAKAVQQIKAVSSKWIHDEYRQYGFEWQEGYGAFSIGVAQVSDTVAYICNQAEHHRRRDFQEEFLAFLEKHDIETPTQDARPAKSACRVSWAIIEPPSGRKERRSSCGTTLPSNLGAQSRRVG